MALRRVYEAPVKRWADHQAAFFNAHFQHDGAPWHPEDFMGGGNRQERVMKRQRDNLDLAREQMRLARIVRGVEPEGLPEWAKGAYHAG